MNRRALIGGGIALGALATSRPVTAQPGRKIARIGILSFAGPSLRLTIPPSLLTRSDEVID